jgi:NADPH-dependent 2,4-dienoyl-CoA reductase/sulfur reductase-like enzyme
MSDIIKNFLVIGGNTAGLAAANQIRRIRPDAAIVVFEAGKYISYGSCSLPYYISGAVDRIEKLFIYSKDYFEKEKNIKILLNHRITEVNAYKKEITASCVFDSSLDGNLTENKTEVFPYDRLVICSGASPVRFDHIPGSGSENVFYFRSVDDALALKEYLRKKDPQSASIIGGGNIGMLLADALGKIGLQINIIEAKQKIFAGYEDEITDILTDAITSQGPKLHTGLRLKQIKTSAADRLAYSAVVEDSSGNGKEMEIDSDIFIIAAGIKANNQFLNNSSLDMAKSGALKVSANMQTSHPGIFAAGDCCLVKNIVTGVYDFIPTAQNALKTGRIAGANAAGSGEYFPGSAGTKVDKLFGFEISKTGIDSETAYAFRFDFIKVSGTFYSHARTVPGAERLTISVIADKKTRQVLGAQIIGKEGAGKRIDVFAASITSGMKVDDLYFLDTSYSPYISTMPDPVNQICGSAVLLLNK